ncbi:MAG: esterase, partial [Bacteroidales bacterium]|nr:esterase [Bacteroidales bacterium]
MKRSVFRILLLFSVTSVAAFSQSSNIPQGSVPAPTNIRPGDCPCIFSDLRVFFRVSAPDAGKVQVDLGKVYDMQRDDRGIWSV